MAQAFPYEVGTVESLVNDDDDEIISDLMGQLIQILADIETRLTAAGV